MRLCPICLNLGELGQRYAEPDAEQYGVDPNTLIQEYICKDCDLSYFDLLRSVNMDSKNLYKGLDFSPSGSRRRHYTLASFMENFFSDGVNFADLGGGKQSLESLLPNNFSGYIFDLFPEEMRSERRIFLDLSDPQSFRAQQISRLGINLVILDNVLEHLTTFAVTEEIIKALDTDYIYVSVPNRKSLKYILNNKKFYRPVEHVNNFSPKSIDLLMGNWGYELISVGPNYKNFLSLFNFMFGISMLGLSTFGIYRFYQKRDIN